MEDRDGHRASKRAMQALLKMKKIDVNELERAYAGG
jgi:predicted 3-demethylubiquinone-9 3-methyltransferase (glyoxalase superfamily)